MDTIIAGQKVARRRRAPAPRIHTKPQSLPPHNNRGIATVLRSSTTRSIRSSTRPSVRFFVRRILDRLLGRITSLGTGRITAFTLIFLGAVLVMSFGIAALLRGPAFPMPENELLPDSPVRSDLLLEYCAPELADSGRLSSDEALDLPPLPATLSYSTYTVRSGDTIGGIAKKFGRSMDSIISANGIENVKALRSGTSLRIPNIDGLVHRVRSGETIGSIAKQYKIETTRLVDANDLGSSTLLPGQSLFIPGARLPETQLKQALGQFIAWPVRGRLSSYFGYRNDPFTGVRRFHAGIDIVTDTGTPIRAAAAGTVSDVGYNANFGNYIIMSHAGGIQTLYGHLSSSTVAKGAKVGQGAMIGLSGNTGYSTGPHLHFGLFKGGVGVNPLKYLK